MCGEFKAFMGCLLSMFVRFSRLQGILKQFQPWCILGFAEQTLQDEIDALETVEDFEVNFRMVRTKRKELDRLPEVIKVPPQFCQFCIHPPSSLQVVFV